MNDEEMQELIQNVFQKILKELKENPDNVFNYLELQKKYNTVLKDKAKLRQENKKLKEAINKAIDEIETGYFIDGDEEYSYLETWFGVETLLNILKEVE